jgi:hypothetical protein
MTGVQVHRDTHLPVRGTLALDRHELHCSKPTKANRPVSRIKHPENVHFNVTKVERIPNGHVSPGAVSLVASCILTTENIIGCCALYCRYDIAVTRKLRLYHRTY